MKTDMTGKPSPEARKRQQRKEIIKYAEKRIDTVIEQIKTGEITNEEAKRIVMKHSSHIPEELKARCRVALQKNQKKEEGA